MRMVEKTGIPKGTLEKYAAQSSNASFPNAVRIAKAIGQSVGQLIHDHDESSKYGVVAAASMILLPTYSEVLASAGPGAVAASEQADGVISFDPRFLRAQGGNPEKCVVIWAHGDSMMPTIPDGSALIVDHSQKEIKNGSIMVIGVDDDLLVKRIRRRSDGLIELISDNRTYETETLGPAALQQLRVIGRVVYFCRTP